MKDKPLPDTPISKTASSEDALQFVRGLQDEYRRQRPVDQKAFIEQYLDRFTRGELRGIGRRILMDIMKRPQISTEAGPEPEAPGRLGLGSGLGRDLRPLHDIHQDPPADAAQFAAGKPVQVLLDKRLLVHGALAAVLILQAPHELERIFAARGLGDGRIRQRLVLHHST